MNKRSCAACSLSDACTELLGVIDKNPEDVLTHRCKEFCGISSGELDVRTKVLETFGVTSLASAITQPKGVHVSYSKEELDQLPRSPLRAMAEKHGMSPAKSTEMPIDELRKYIFSKQPGGKSKTVKKTTKKTTAKATPEPASEDENSEPDEGRTRPGRVDYEDEGAEGAEEGSEDEKVEAEPEAQPAVASGDLESRVDKLQKTVEALGDMMGEYVDIQKKHRRFDRRAFAVMDRKINCVLGSMDMIGANIIDKDFDPLKFEESYSKKYKHVVPLGAIQKATGDPVDEGEG